MDGAASEGGEIAAEAPAESEAEAPEASADDDFSKFFDDESEGIEMSAKDSDNSEAEDEPEKARADDEGDDDSDAPEEDKKTESKEKTWKIKANKRERELTEAELVKSAEKGFAAEEKWQEAARMRKEADQVASEAKDTLRKVEEGLTNPRTCVSALKAISPSYIHDLVVLLAESSDPEVRAQLDGAAELLQAAPEARRAHTLERENERLWQQRQQWERQQQEARQRQQEAQQAQAQAQYQEQTQAAFKEMAAGALKSIGLEADAQTIGELGIAYNQVSPDLPISPETVAAAAEHLAQKIGGLSSRYIGNLKPEKLSEVIGQEKLEAIKQRELQKVKRELSKPRQPGATKRKPGKKSPSLEELGFTDYQEWS